MATDIILEDEKVKISDGSLHIDTVLEAGNKFSSTSEKLRFDARGLSIKDDSHASRITSTSVFSRNGGFTKISAKDASFSNLQLGRGKASEPGDSGVLTLENGMGVKSISFDGKTGEIKCNEIHLETIGNLVAVIKQLQNDIRILKNK